MLVLELFILLPYLGASGRVVAIKQANIFQVRISVFLLYVVGANPSHRHVLHSFIGDAVLAARSPQSLLVM